MKRGRAPSGSVSVILPTLNEKDNIVPLIRSVFKNTPPGTDVVVVDDDSPDGTWRLVERLAGKSDNLKLLRRTEDRGLTSALRDGIKLIRGRICVWMDSDLSMPPEMIPSLLAEIEKGADLAVGSRYLPGGGVEIVSGGPDSPAAYLFSLVLNRYLRFVLGPGFTDWTSGFIAVRREVLNSVPLRGDYGDYFIDLVYRAKKLGFTTREIPYLCRARRAGRGKTFVNVFNFLQKGWKYFILPLRLRLTKIPKAR
ncbi:MAG: glycosyltransferase [Candidatus Aminicenantes bacterium]|nr:glycosyltransferase [Candidatus Aminicenantes bacterium]